MVSELFPFAVTDTGQRHAGSGGLGGESHGTRALPEEENDKEVRDCLI